MHRSDIKRLAKERLRGNIFNILWPLFVIMVVNMFIIKYIKIDIPKVSTFKEIFNLWHISYIKGLLVSIIMGIINAGYMKYLLDFVRTGEFRVSSIFDTIGRKFIDITIASILSTILISIGYILFFVPGVILTFAYSMTTFIVIDNEVSGVDALRASRELMAGHKFDLFLLLLSFYGWFLLSILTLGLALIWVVPYVLVCVTTFYDEIK